MKKYKIYHYDFIIYYRDSCVLLHLLCIIKARKILIEMKNENNKRGCSRKRLSVKQSLKSTHVLILTSLVAVGIGLILNCSFN